MASFFPTNDELFIMVDQLVELHRQEKSAMMTSVDTLGELHRGKAEARMRLSPKEFAQLVGLTVDQYFKRLAVYRTLLQFPQLREKWTSGEITFSHIVAMGPRLTLANVDVMLSMIKGKTKSETRMLASLMTKDGSLVPEPAV